MKLFKLTEGIKKYILVMFTFCVVQVFCELYLPSIMSNIVDLGISSSDTTYIISQISLMFIISIIGLISNVIVIYSTSKFSNEFGYYIREALYKKISSFSKKEIDKFGASTLITRSTNNVSNITSTFSFGLRLIIFAPIMGMVAIVMAYSKAQVLAPIVVMALIILFVCLLIIFASVFTKFEQLQKLLDRLNKATREMLSGIRVIKAFNKEKYFKNKFDKVNKENMDLNIFLNKILYLVQPMMILIINLATVAVCYISMDFINRGELEIGAMMAFIQYLSTILVSFLILLVIILNIPRVIVSIKRINEILNEEPSILDNGHIKLQKLESIEFKNVYFKYENASNDMLKDISFRIEKGQKIGIIGSSGSGKTTIINLLLRHLDVTSGSILINGIDIREYTQESLRNIFSYTPQRALLFKGSLKENLEFDNKNNIEELNNVAFIADIKDLIETKENGYDFELEQSAVNLSGGQKQRVSIARALLSKGECLIFDDSFSSVDNITDKKIRSSISKYYNDKLVLLIAQRVNTVKDCDKIIVIENGKIESIGKYKELLKKSSVFKEFYSSQKEEVKL